MATLGIARALQLQAIRALAARGSSGVRVKEVVVSDCVRNQDIVRISIDLVFSSREARGGMVFLEAGVLGADTTCATFANRKGRATAHARVTLAALEEHESWNGAVIRVEQTVHLTRVPTIVLPDILPLPVSGGHFAESKPGVQPLIRHDIAASGLESIGIEGPESEATSYLQLVMWPSEETGPRDDFVGVIMSRSALDRLRTSRANLTSRRLAQLRDRIAGVFKSDTLVKVLVVPKENWIWPPWHPSGCVLAVSASDYEADAADWVAAEHNLLRRLASAWWGRGVCIVGRRGLELQWAVAGAVALYGQKEELGVSNLERLLDFYRRGARSSRLIEHWNGLRGLVRNRLTARWTLVLYERICGDTQVLGQIQRLTRASWGSGITVEQGWEQLGGEP